QPQPDLEAPVVTGHLDTDGERVATATVGDRRRYRDRRDRRRILGSDAEAGELAVLEAPAQPLAEAGVPALLVAGVADDAAGSVLAHRRSRPRYRRRLAPEPALSAVHDVRGQVPAADVRTLGLAGQTGA